MSAGTARFDRLRVAQMVTVLIFGISIAAFLAARPASTATGTAGPINVQVSPSVGLADGQVLNIHAEATNGAELFEIRAHVCSTGAISNFVDFGYQGPHCVAADGIKEGGLSGDYETFVVPDNRVSGDLQFRAGTGSVGWLDEIGYPHTLTCGPGAPCALVVQLQTTNATTYYATDLCWGDGCPSEPGEAPPPPPPSAPADSVPPAGDAAATSGQGAAGAAVTPAAKAAGGSAAASKAVDAKARDQALGDDARPASLTVDPEDIPRSVRVLAAEAAGIAGGVLIVLIVMRARRRMAADAARYAPARASR